MFPIKIEPAHFLQYSVMFVVGILMLGIQHMTDGIWMGAFGKFVSAHPVAPYDSSGSRFEVIKKGARNICRYADN